MTTTPELDLDAHLETIAVRRRVQDEEHARGMVELQALADVIAFATDNGSVMEPAVAIRELDIPDDAIAQTTRDYGP